MWWILALFISIAAAFSSLYTSHNVTQQTEITVSAQQQAMMTLAYINAINDWLYGSPLADGVVPDDVLSVRAPPGTHNIVASGRVWVWQLQQRGLMYQLEKASSASALIGKVRNGRLTDAIGTDMGVPVPSSIPDGAIVYLN